MDGCYWLYGRGEDTVSWYENGRDRSSNHTPSISVSDGEITFITIKLTHWYQCVNAYWTFTITIK